MRLDLILLVPVLALLFALPRRLHDRGVPASDIFVRIDEQRSSHVLFRKNLLAAHLNLLSGARARILAAYPAGNSGVAVWIQSARGDVAFSWTTMPTAVPGRRGAVTFDVKASVDELTITQAVLGSVRSIREWDIDKLKPNEIAEQTELVGPREVRFRRPSLDGKNSYEMILLVANGTVRRDHENRVTLASDRGGAPLALRVTCVSTEKPLTPLPAERLLKPEVLARTDERSVQMLSFLMYREKFLAGSWTYLTYFGRDTLLTLRLLMRALAPEAIESMLGAVVDRLREDGNVAHEEEIGDYAALRAHQQGRGFDSKPNFDYRMIDDDFLLAPVLVAYAHDANPARLAAFVARRTPSGRTYRDAILANLDYVERHAAPFAREPVFRNLISLPRGQPEGNWRDSHPGVGWGRYVFDVNAALVPAALKAARVILSLPAFDAHDERRIANLLAATQTWATHAARLFRVEVPRDEAERDAAAYAKRFGLEAPEPPGRAVAFDGVSLDEHGRVIPVMNSDEGFVMMFGDPPEETLSHIADLLLAPFPYGLASEVGLVVANPAFAGENMQGNFTPQHYHGTVVWSWQQALMAAAVRRQIERGDISDFVRRKLGAAEVRVWDLITRTEKYRSAELWTWREERGHMSYIPFGQNAGDHSEANPNQGWSHAFLGVRPPPDLGRSTEPQMTNTK